MIDVILGDCVQVMAAMPESSVDAIVTDPPYGLEFMGKDWDRLIAPTGGASFTEASGRPDQREHNKGGSWFGARDGSAPSYTGSPNPSCRNCGGSRRGNNRKGGFTRCRCDRPEFPNHQLNQQRGMQAWHEAWAIQALRIVKPGGHLLAFGGTRTYHRLACAIEDAGFEIRDSIADFGCLGYIYGSGFPKSHDVSKALDKAKGIERENKFEGSFERRAGPTGNRQCDACGKWLVSGDPCRCARPQDRPVSELAQKYDGWGTALKPAWEPIVVARKPLIGTVAANVERYGTGGLNIDACRIAAMGGSPAASRRQGKPSGRPGEYGDGHSMVSRVTPERYAEPREGEKIGRWPANVVLTHHAECERLGEQQVRSDGHWSGEDGSDATSTPGYDGGFTKGGMRRVKSSAPPGPGSVGMGYHGADGQAGTVAYGDDGYEWVEAWRCVPECAVRLLDEASGAGQSSKRLAGSHGQNVIAYGDMNTRREPGAGYVDSGGASRFFYTAKASRSEREAWGRIAKSVEPMRRTDGRKTEHHVPNLRTTTRVNDHPTVKPIDLMAWLVRLVTPPDGTVLDPFAGSGTTLVAAQRERYNAIGIEMDPRSARIAKARVDAMWEVKLL